MPAMVGTPRFVDGQTARWLAQLEGVRSWAKAEQASAQVRWRSGPVVNQLVVVGKVPWRKQFWVFCLN